jgi:hypothetical protein
VSSAKRRRFTLRRFEVAAKETKRVNLRTLLRKAGHTTQSRNRRHRPDDEQVCKKRVMQRGFLQVLA